MEREYTIKFTGNQQQQILLTNQFTTSLLAFDAAAQAARRHVDELANSLDRLKSTTTTLGNLNQQFTQMAPAIHALIAEVSRLTAELNTASASATTLKVSLPVGGGVGAGAVPVGAGGMATPGHWKMGRWVGMQVGAHAVRGAIRAAGEAFEAGGETALAQGQQFLDFQKSLREMVGNRGVGAVQGPAEVEAIGNEMLALSRELGMSPKQVVEFQTLFESGIGAAKLTKKIGPKLGQAAQRQLQQRIGAEALAFANRVAIPPKTIADLTVKSLESEEINNIGDFRSLLLNWQQTLGVVGVGNVGELARGAAIESATLGMTGRVPVRQEGAFYATASLARTPAGARAFQEQLDAGLHPKTPEAQAVMKAALAGTPAGLNQELDAVRTRQLKTYLDNKGIKDYRAYLQANGWGNVRQRDAMAHYMTQIDFLEGQIAEVERLRANPDAVVEAQRAFEAVPERRAERAQAGQEATDIETGSRFANYNVMREQAIETLKKEGRFQTTGGSWAARLGRLFSFGAQPGEDLQIDAAIYSRLALAARKAGVDVNRNFFSLGTSLQPIGSAFYSPEFRRRELQRLEAQVRERGGTPDLGLSDQQVNEQLGELIGLTRKSVQQRDEANKDRRRMGGGPAPHRGFPPEGDRR